MIVSVMMSVSVLMPICALVNLIDSTSTYPEDPPAIVMCPFVLEIARLVVPVCECSSIHGHLKGASDIAHCRLST